MQLAKGYHKLNLKFTQPFYRLKQLYILHGPIFT